MTDDCPFCAILGGEFDAHVVHETDDAMAFLDLNPVSRGHTLVVPKAHAERLDDLDAATTEGLFTTVRDVVERLEDGLDPEGVNVLQNNGEAAGQEVDHVHVHVIPRHGDDGLDITFDQGDLEDAGDVLDALRG